LWERHLSAILSWLEAIPQRTNFLADKVARRVTTAACPSCRPAAVQCY
jgi:hypothetical protein